MFDSFVLIDILAMYLLHCYYTRAGVLLKDTLVFGKVWFLERQSVSIVLANT